MEPISLESKTIRFLVTKCCETCSHYTHDLAIIAIYCKECYITSKLSIGENNYQWDRKHLAPKDVYDRFLNKNFELIAVTINKTELLTNNHNKQDSDV